MDLSVCFFFYCHASNISSTNPMVPIAVPVTATSWAVYLRSTVRSKISLTYRHMCSTLGQTALVILLLLSLNISFLSLAFGYLTSGCSSKHRCLPSCCPVALCGILDGYASIKAEEDILGELGRIFYRDRGSMILQSHSIGHKNAPIHMHSYIDSFYYSWISMIVKRNIES